MTVGVAMDERRLRRDSGRAVFGGVCAGLADYFGLNLTVTRLLAVIAFFCAMPFAVMAYIAALFLMPASGDRGAAASREARRTEERRKEALREEILAARPSAEEMRARYAAMDERLAKIEKYVTSSRFELDEEFRRL